MTPIIEVSGVVKDYRGLRPLRVEELSLEAGDAFALLGVDRLSAEVLINLITGTTLPDRGTVRVFGQSTVEIRDSVEWMALVDRFGIITERAVLLDALSVVQNLSMPFSLEVEPPSDGVRARAEALAQEVGLAESSWDSRVAELDLTSQMRIRLGRALALTPQALLLEHPTAAVPREHVDAFARCVRGVVERRGLTALTLTADREFAEAAARRVLTLNPSTGRVTASRPGWFTRFGR